ncbi:hypothetical protein ACFWEO_28615 [Streptomyces roseolus]|uniref:hypothetical protein n=1 Tax=Streptomyces roseolus TaxID=67358 RepID=UPI00366703E6
MPHSKDQTDAPPRFELRLGGLHLTVQHIPSWLVALVTTAGGAALTWWTQH